MNVTQTDFADIIKVTKGRVSQMIKEGIIKREPDGLLDPVKCKKQWRKRRSYRPVIVKPKTKQEKRAEGNAYDDLIKFRAEVMESKAEKEKMLVEEMRKKLVNKAEIMAVFNKVLTKNNAAIKSKLIALPRKLALEWPDPKQKAIVETCAQAVVNLCLEDLANIDLKKITK